jgi:putative radical SAM enzyme (TIGR03279 family)
MHPLITGVERGTIAAGAGFQTGDRLIAINGNEICDVLDYKYHSEDTRLSIEIERGGKRHIIKLKKPESEPLGLVFESYLMDKARSCANKCVFCFIDQLPRGMRDTLYFKDDDARLSFLTGNYITLTNLSPREVQRIIGLRISPINISVHTTNPQLRSRMLGNKNAGSSLETMKAFAEARIEMNCQIVVCPGLNDGEELSKTMSELSSLFPAVSSVSVVPVGLTRHRRELGLYPLEPVDKLRALEIINAVDSFGKACLAKLGSRLFYCGDELYLKAGLEIPADAYYEGYPQYENGVGMLRSLEDEFIAALDDKVLFSDASAGKNSFSVATGHAAQALLTKLLQIANKKCYDIRGYNLQGCVYGIENRFFGNMVDVAGLITGQDLIAQLQGKRLGSRLLISSNMLRHGGDMFLDDITLEEASKALGVPIIPVPNDGAELLRAFL